MEIGTYHCPGGFLVEQTTDQGTNDGPGSEGDIYERISFRVSAAILGELGDFLLQSFNRKGQVCD
ncbi:MAG: hypothetical protein Q9200_001136 [Gallowayella weberi]